MNVLERLAESLQRPIIVGTLEDFIATAKLEGVRSVTAEIGERKVSNQPEDHIPEHQGYDTLEFYTKFIALAGWRTLVFATINDIATLARTRKITPGSMNLDNRLYDQAQLPYHHSLLKTDEARRRLIAQGFKVTVKRRGVVYSDEEFARMVRGAHLIGSFTG